MGSQFVLEIWELDLEVESWNQTQSEDGKVYERERKRVSVSWIGFRACGVTRARKRITAVGCPSLTGLGLRHGKGHDDSSDNYVPFWITLINVYLFIYILERVKYVFVFLENE